MFIYCLTFIWVTYWFYFSQLTFNIDNKQTSSLRPFHMKSSGAKRVMRKNKKIQFSLVFACNVLALCYVKIFSRKTSYKAGCGRFAISVLLQNGISDSDLFPQNGLYPFGQSPPSLFSRCGSRLTWKWLTLFWASGASFKRQYESFWRLFRGHRYFAIGVV